MAMMEVLLFKSRLIINVSMCRVEEVPQNKREKQEQICNKRSNNQKQYITQYKYSEYRYAHLVFIFCYEIDHGTLHKSLCILVFQGGCYIIKSHVSLCELKNVFYLCEPKITCWFFYYFAKDLTSHSKSIIAGHR